MIEFDLKYYNKSVKIRHNGGHYYHENSFDILEEYGYEFVEKDRTEQAIEQLNNYEFYENGDLYENGSI